MPPEAQAPDGPVAGPFEAGLDAPTIRRLAAQALAEDVGSGDITTELCVPESVSAAARAVAREPGVLAGLPVFCAVFEAVSERVRFEVLKVDGSRFEAGETLCLVRGPARALLTGERVALNFLQRCSGIATQTARFVEALAGTSAVILDTRKTVPGLRLLDKYAVRMGGGRNHRLGLYDGILIKDNHIAAAGSLAAAVRQARAGMPGRVTLLEVECDTLDQVKECIELGVPIILLDNMPVEVMRRAVALGAGRLRFEASGNVHLGNVAEVARTGVDFISVGSLTHSARALDLGLDFE